jgi:XTP/dITP diphosphohydrolase
VSHAKPNRLLVATLNPGKVREFAQALVPEGIEVFGLDHLDDMTPVEETGSTFEENARQKAEGYSRRTELTVLADDSGLEVDALGGEPGVHSARYGGEDLDDEGRNRLVLETLRAVTDPERRTARFRCVLAVARSGRTLATFDGVVEGRILFEPAGHDGFGYDPLFFHPESGCTTAQLSTCDKQRVSHRGQAIAALLRAIRAGDPRLAGSG